MSGFGYDPLAMAGKSQGPNKTTLPPREELRLKNAAADFEAMFVKQMMAAMRKTIPKDPDGGLIREGQGEKIFREMLDGEYANMMSHRGSGMGLGNMLFKQLVARYQLQANAGSAPGTEAAQGLEKIKSEGSSVSALQFSPKK